MLSSFSKLDRFETCLMTIGNNWSDATQLLSKTKTELRIGTHVPLTDMTYGCWTHCHSVGPVLYYNTDQYFCERFTTTL